VELNSSGKNQQLNKNSFFILQTFGGIFGKQIRKNRILAGTKSSGENQVIKYSLTLL